MRIEIFLRDKSTGVRSNVPDHRFDDVIKIKQDEKYMAVMFQNGNKEAFNHDYVERVRIIKDSEGQNE